MKTWKALFGLPLGLGALSLASPATLALAKPAAAPTSRGSAPPPKAAPGLPAEVQAIHGLVGQWRGNGSAQFGPEQVKVQFSLACTLTSAGFGVQCKTYFSGLPGSATLEETDLFGFDPGRGKYHWFSVTNQGEAHDHVADVSKTDTLRFVYDGVQEGKPMQEVITLKVAENHRDLEFLTTVSVGGQVTAQLSGRATK
jgi:hypothetical protein